ncbi:exopolygalacturonase-like [Rhodamnia argentea]|uniref:Exopolygalacturonase-like n=1 Tax=Rhodamnia argentea TaxID=178133 RepID=A0A8B8QX41_9MYRT|nr:exopolygalacturonase-like [Rhodamnia argentea]
MDSSLCFPKICLLLFPALVLTSGVHSRSHDQVKVFDVRSFGAVADGKTDDSKAFLDAWNDACQYKSGLRRRLFIPHGTYMVWPVVFKGPCTGPIVFTLKGVVKAPVDKSTFSLDHWIAFQYLSRLLINGGGTFDGQGLYAWPENECACKSLPVSVRFNFVNNTWIRRISSVNSKNFHFNVFKCDDLEFWRVRIIAPDESPNTDGIHIGDSSRIRITDSMIATGDDCVSVGPGSKDVEVVDVHCGPGHGFSVGSLGRYPNEADVIGLSVRSCTMVGTQNGLRIKTWASPLKSSVQNISFHDITMKDVLNPIIIDQEYCPGGGCAKQPGSNVQINGVSFTKIRGTSASEVAVSLVCSPNVPCKNINLHNIDLTYPGGRGPAKSRCAHVNGQSGGVQNPVSCI